jgi:GNAT superfamily N-acetyltransferase
LAELKISTVQSDGDLMDFIHFPWEVYRDDPYWVPPFINERREFLSKEHNPFFEHARAEYFLAHRGTKVVGIIAAFTNDKHNEFQGVNTGFFGFFEVLDDHEAAAALLSAAEDWARKAGHETILGPAQFSLNDEATLLVDGFDDAPRILLTYNPPRYMTYLDAAGYQKAMDLFAYKMLTQEFIQNVPPKVLRVVEAVKKRGDIKLRNANMKNFIREVKLFKQVYNKSWERNWGFVPITDLEIDRLAEQLKPLIDPDLVTFGEIEGEIAGASLSLPDVNQPLLKAYPRPGMPEILTTLKLGWHWKVRGGLVWLRGFAMGVLPQFRRMGIDALMYMDTFAHAARKGYEWIEMSLILENNVPTNRIVRLLGGEVYKTYRMYEKRL